MNQFTRKGWKCCQRVSRGRLLTIRLLHRPMFVIGTTYFASVPSMPAPTFGDPEVEPDQQG